MTASFPIRPEVLDFDPYSPGLSIEEIRERHGLENVVKMASNENPLGVSPLAAEAMRRAADSAFRYAPSGNPALLKKIAEKHGLPVENIAAGNGSDEVIDLLVRACPTPGVHNAVAFNPCFSLYKLQSKLCGVEFRQAPLREDFSFDFDGLRALVDDKTALVFITTPDNPSGWCPEVDEVRRFLLSLPSTCLLVVDEAYMDFCADENAHSLLPEFRKHSNLVILRTFSKSYGLAGVRLGYGIMPAHLAAALKAVRPPFSINSQAEAAGMAALDDTAFRAATLKTVKEGREFLTEAMRGLGCRVYPSMANFIMFELPEGFPPAKQVFEFMLSRGVIIRPLTSYGLSGHLRISVGTMPENRLFIDLLKQSSAL